jgi:hypothetical protein
MVKRKVACSVRCRSIQAIVPLATILSGFDIPKAWAADPSPNPYRSVLFSSLEAGPSTQFGSVGLKLAIAEPLDTTGFRILAKVGGGVEPIRAASPKSQAVTPEGRALVGHEWKIGSSYIALYAGLDVDSRFDLRTLSPMRRTRAGAAVQADLWSNPTPETLIHLSANLGSASRHVWARAAAGWQLFGGAFVGPEIEIYREQDYRKDRIGMHVTGVRLLNSEIRLSAGWQRSGQDEKGPYVSLNAQWKR